ncbi:MAG: nucleoside triphosphate pyrophosphohydrolase [Zetaproteobacteria bacterium CG06_land_8_20_14_3_00_59_53]|nr:MAG: nucleoside triphosphate pyrophosphohydrolase [Zetaproteobacteria bacterium CG2_30_59_37]PIO90698.1 MAG: nucleoside triphosphate pyrophosphohydrolase [Zetaproteobacteria bacterium CG23_combo_of_CG06-09_8_20_14_all_59_86]PIU71617.1 MAG: nucleoside triphosphate pyrophosphohydrolase [Zetaproteobacteria bacterium CG06_land_8_20_14_3_00_59_53]PIU97902.1 MAG: nucleoside triphosphate pyrophosphohydrolase [Zetaproteobacteria bacterium CG03_land_8_20_14_0_80_59_51]PIY47377.1 MAG: nucleoside triph
MPDRIHSKDNYYDKLKELMNVLRKECPWDAEQTLESLRTYTLEEVHEVFEAIELAVQQDNWRQLQAELGDLLFQVLFYACIAGERNQFNLDDVAGTLISKMINRHPHVFSSVQTEDLGRQWESLKDEEHAQRTSLMDEIPPLPALARAHKIQRRASRVGFDWTQASDVIAKMHEELGELEHEVKQNASHARLQDEFGDVLFTLVNLGRKLDVDAELALMHTNRKFSERFRGMEALAESRGLNLDGMSLDNMELLYLEAKRLQTE